MAWSDFYVLTVMGLMTLVARIGSPAIRDLIVAVLSGVAFRLSRAKRTGSEATLARVFGARLTARRRRTIVRRAFREHWSDVFALLPLRGVARDATGIVGEDRLRQALAEGRGAILWISNHWARLTTLKRALHAHGFAVHKVHAEQHLGGFSGHGDTWVQQRIITPFFDRHESAIVAGIVTIKRGSLSVVRDLAACLQANGIVCVAADGHNGQRFIPHSLLGIDEAFPTGAVTLARTSGAPLLPVFCLPGPGRSMQVVVEPAVALPAGLDREGIVRAAIDQYVARLEHRMRRHPSRYVNWHLIGRELPPRAETVSVVRVPS